MTTNERNENKKKNCKTHKQTLNTEAHERYIYAQDKRCIKGQTAGLIVYVPKAKTPPLKNARVNQQTREKIVAGTFLVLKNVCP